MYYSDGIFPQEEPLILWGDFQGRTLFFNLTLSRSGNPQRDYGRVLIMLMGHTFTCRLLKGFKPEVATRDRKIIQMLMILKEIDQFFKF